MFNTRMLTFAFLVSSFILPHFIPELAFLFLAMLAYITYKYVST